MKKFARVRKCACGASMYLNCRWSPQNSSLWNDGVANGNREDEEERNVGVRRSNTCLQGGRFLFFRFLPFILSDRSMGRRSRALFRYCSRERHRRQRHEKKKRRLEVRSVWKMERKFRRQEVSPRPYEFACERLDVLRDFVLTFAWGACLLRRMRLFKFQLTLGIAASLIFLREIYGCD